MKIPAFGRALVNFEMGAGMLGELLARRSAELAPGAVQGLCSSLNGAYV